MAWGCRVCRNEVSKRQSIGKVSLDSLPLCSHASIGSLEGRLSTLLHNKSKAGSELATIVIRAKGWAHSRSCCLHSKLDSELAWSDRADSAIGLPDLFDTAL